MKIVTCKEWDWRYLRAGEVGLTAEPRLGKVTKFDIRNIFDRNKCPNIFVSNKFT